MTSRSTARLALWVAMAAAAAPASAQMAHGPLVEAGWLERHLDHENVVVLHADMRRSGYDDGHVPGARFLDMTRIVWDGEPAWGNEMRSPAEIEVALEELGVQDGLHHVVLYADNPLFASRAFMTLEVLGFKGRVHVLDGGWSGWVDDGRPVSTEAPAIEMGDLTIDVDDDILVSADWIHERLGDATVALIDARPDDEYTGEDGGMGGMANPGHIPGAHQMYWEELIESREDPITLEREALQSLFAEAGADEGDTVVAYCMVGWRASYNYLVSRMLGYETKFYDGSWHDWGTRDDLPTVTGRSPG
ncbi:MAG: rhodanese-like domain-containing protein [Gemmatimonadota bacterium]